MTITEFLEARLSEDEAVARVATPGLWEVGAMDAGHSRYEMNVWIAAENGDTVCEMDGLERSHNEVFDDDGYRDAQHIARHDPTRVLAECAAKRELLRFFTSNEPYEMSSEGEWVIKALAAIYKDHSDYQPDWEL